MTTEIAQAETKISHVVRMGLNKVYNDLANKELLNITFPGVASSVLEGRPLFSSAHFQSSKSQEETANNRAIDVMKKFYEKQLASTTAGKLCFKHVGEENMRDRNIFQSQLGAYIKELEAGKRPQPELERAV